MAEMGASLTLQLQAHRGYPALLTPIHRSPKCVKHREQLGTCGCTGAPPASSPEPTGLAQFRGNPVRPAAAAAGVSDPSAGQSSRRDGGLIPHGYVIKSALGSSSLPTRKAGGCEAQRDEHLQSGPLASRVRRAAHLPHPPRYRSAPPPAPSRPHPGPIPARPRTHRQGSLSIRGRSWRRCDPA